MPKIGTNPIRPLWQTTDGETVRLYQGDVRNVLRGLPAKSVQCIMTSPPYWGLRDYGTGEWEGGDSSCNHSKPDDPKSYLGSDGEIGRNCTNWDNRHGLKRVCKKCGAKRVDRQLGSEATPQEFVQNMVEVFREVRRVMRDDATLWLNLGDTYVGGQLQGVPWKTAFALQDDGWVLRQDILWAKKSPMPESVKNRCTKSHEYLFLFAKQQGYFYDNEAIKEESVGEWNSTTFEKRDISGMSKIDLDLMRTQFAFKSDGTPTSHPDRECNNRNKRSVWTIASQGYPGAHFATFPFALVEPCILAGTSEYGACADCGAPWKRIVEEKQLTRERPNNYVKRNGAAGTGNSCANSVAGVETKTLGWEKTCGCETDEVRPCVVLDPFIGSGTVSLVSIEHGRLSWGIDLSKEYLTNHDIPRIQSELMSRPAMAHLAGVKGPQPISGGREI